MTHQSSDEFLLFEDLYLLVLAAKHLSTEVESRTPWHNRLNASQARAPLPTWKLEHQKLPSDHRFPKRPLPPDITASNAFKVGHHSAPLFQFRTLRYYIALRVFNLYTDTQTQLLLHCQLLIKCYNQSLHMCKIHL